MTSIVSRIGIAIDEIITWQVGHIYQIFVREFNASISHGDRLL
jgi:hypothetical protein